jgi:hypothetical protein
MEHQVQLVQQDILQVVVEVGIGIILPEDALLQAMVE